MTENIKEWLTNLLETELEDEKIAVDNETLWKDAGGDSALIHAANIEEHKEYIKILEKIKAEYLDN